METAERRWSEIVAERPDLAPAVDLQRALVQRILTLARTLDEEWRPTLSARHVAAKLTRGVPALRDEDVPLPLEILTPALLSFCGDLEAGGAGDAARHVRETLDAGRLQPASLLRASLARNQRGVRLTAAELDLSADLLWLIGELAVGPAAHALQTRLFAAADPGTAAAREAGARWDEGCCPACGSWPALAAIVGGERSLVCSFCGAAWRPAAYRCVYCREEGEPFRTAAPDLERIGRRLELCGACGGYLKSLDLAAAPVFPLASLEDLATSDLDVAAMQQGYARPPMADLPR